MQQRAHKSQHDDDVEDDAGHKRQRGVGGRGSHPEGERGQRDPGGHVVGGGNRNGQHAKRRAHHPALVEDARQNRKRRDAHRHALKRREWQHRDAGRSVSRVEPRGQSCAQRERDRQRRRADREDAAPGDVARVEVEADEKEEQQQPDLAQPAERVQMLRREQLR